MSTVFTTFPIAEKQTLPKLGNPGPLFDHIGMAGGTGFVAPSFTAGCLPLFTVR